MYTVQLHASSFTAQCMASMTLIRRTIFAHTSSYLTLHSSDGDLIIVDL